MNLDVSSLNLLVNIWFILNTDKVAPAWTHLSVSSRFGLGTYLFAGDLAVFQNGNKSKVLG